MKHINKLLVVISMGLSLMLMSFSTLAAPVIQLGFALDGSGSVSTSNYNQLRSGLSAALSAVPTDGTVEVTIVSYGSSVSTVVNATVVTAATLPMIQASIASHSKDNGNTNTAGAINQLTSLLTASTNFADPGTTSLINLMTDGAPNSQNAAVAASLAAAAAGIDALSIEAIGSGVSSASALANMLAMAFPDPATILAVNETNISNPLGGSWVIPVSDFDSLAPVLAAKVLASITPPVDVPEPSILALLALGLLMTRGFTSRRRAA